jgi:hypothetical protein
VSGIACIVGALWFWTRLKGIRRQMRPIYERLGIVPGIAAEEGAQN